MTIRPMALCFGLALTPGFAVTAHATYAAIVLADPGGMGNNKVWDINSLGESVGMVSDLERPGRRALVDDRNLDGA